MVWSVDFYGAFSEEFDELSESVQDELLSHAKLLKELGPKNKPTESRYIKRF